MTCIDCSAPAESTYCDLCNAPITYSPRQLMQEVREEIEKGKTNADLPPVC